MYETTYDDLKKIFEMVNYVINFDDNKDDIDKLTEYQLEIPYKLKNLEDVLLTMFE